MRTLLLVTLSFLSVHSQVPCFEISKDTTETWNPRTTKNLLFCGLVEDLPRGQVIVNLQSTNGDTYTVSWGSAVDTSGTCANFNADGHEDYKGNIDVVLNKTFTLQDKTNVPAMQLTCGNALLSCTVVIHSLKVCSLGPDPSTTSGASTSGVPPAMTSAGATTANGPPGVTTASDGGNSASATTSGATTAAASGHGTTGSSNEAEPWYKGEYGSLKIAGIVAGGCAILLGIYLAIACHRRNERKRKAKYEPLQESHGHGHERPRAEAARLERAQAAAEEGALGVQIKWLFAASVEAIQDLRAQLIPALQRQGPVASGELKFTFNVNWSPGKVHADPNGGRPWLCLGAAVRANTDLRLNDVWETAQKARRHGWNVFVLLARIGKRGGAIDLADPAPDGQLTFAKKGDGVYVIQKFNAPFYAFELFINGPTVDMHPELMFSIWKLVSQ